MTPTLLRNRYRIIRELADGGFGKTFLAEDTDTPLGRRCVIKQLKPVTNNPQVYQLVKERFQREAAILEELGDSSNQIPRLYAYFLENGQFYLVQEWIQGQTLSNKLQQQGLLSESSVKEILVGILPVLEYVHSKGIVHRDIKPDNIILRSSDGKPVLIDFGAVKETMGTVVTASGNSGTSIVIGTPGFMPSEQAIGRPMFSSDLYSLGLTAIYLLTGKIPQDLETDPRTGEMLWRQYAGNVSPGFAAVLDKAIQSHARDRYATPREMLEALQFEATPIPHPMPSPQLPYVQPPVVPPQPVSSPLLKDWQKAVIIGSAIGACIVGGLLVIRQPPSQQQIVTQPNASPEPSEPPNNPPPPEFIPSPSPPQFSPPPSSISQQDAVNLINAWLQAKRELFAPPFNRQLGAELTTGEAYRKNVGADGSSVWLENNNAYYRYGVQRIDGVENFVASGDQATIEVVITEDRKYYQKGEIVYGKNTEFDTSLVRYSLQLEDGQLKISDYNTVRDIN